MRASHVFTFVSTPLTAGAHAARATPTSSVGSPGANAANSPSPPILSGKRPVRANDLDETGRDDVGRSNGLSRAVPERAAREVGEAAIQSCSGFVEMLNNHPSDCSIDRRPDAQLTVVRLLGSSHGLQAPHRR